MYMMSAGRGRARAERLGETGRMDGTGGGRAGGGLASGWLHATAGWTHGLLAPGGAGGGDRGE